MYGSPLLLLARAYGLAAAVALLGSAIGALGPVSAALVAWLGGAAAVLILGLLQGRPAPQVVDADAADAVLAEALRGWEADRLADLAQTGRNADAKAAGS